MAKAKKSRRGNLFKARFRDVHFAVVPCKKIKVAYFYSGPKGKGVANKLVTISGPPAQVDALMKLVLGGGGS